MPKTIPPTPSATKPLAPYSVATEAHGFVFISGQVALDPATGERSPDDVAVQAKRVLDNIGVILGDVGLGFADVVKTTIFLTDMGDFATVNDVYRGYFDVDPPARSTFQVAGLPAGFLVEIEAVAAR
jgi:2-iminobutanoate/2-iminopropanoate deaminase